MLTAAATIAANAASTMLMIVDDGSRAIAPIAAALDGIFRTLACGSHGEAIKCMRELEAPPAMALVDIGPSTLSHRPDEGVRFIGELLAHAPDMKIFACAADGDALRARRVRALGAVEFLTRSTEPESMRQLLRDVLLFHSADSDTAGSAALIGTSAPLRKLRRQIDHYARLACPMLIEGEPGSEPARVAAALHTGSMRREERFRAFHCAGPAAGDVIAGAREGSLFLEEIGALPLDSQARLLRMLEDDEVSPGSHRARIIAATSRDLREAVRSSDFLRELHGRLSTFALGVPPVRELEDDGVLLLDHHRERYAATAGVEPFRLDAQAVTAWRTYAFPGNQRELRHVVMRLTSRYPGREITADQLAAELGAGPQSDPRNAAFSHDANRLTEAAQRHLESESRFDLDRTLGAWQQGYITAAMKLTAGNVSRAAKLLGLNRTTLYSRLESLRKPS